MLTYMSVMKNKLVNQSLKDILYDRTRSPMTCPFWPVFSLPQNVHRALKLPTKNKMARAVVLLSTPVLGQLRAHEAEFKTDGDSFA